jgi:hypothetical protein
MVRSRTVPDLDPSPLFRYLEERGISQIWLAAKLECSTQYLTEIKSGRRNVPEWMPERASAVLAIPTFMLFDGLANDIETVSA